MSVPLIVAYHPMIRVGSVVLTGGFDDYYSDEEISDSLVSNFGFGFDGAVDFLRSNDVIILPEGSLYIDIGVDG